MYIRGIAGYKISISYSQGLISYHCVVEYKFRKILSGQNFYILQSYYLKYNSHVLCLLQYQISSRWVEYPQSPHEAPVVGAVTLQMLGNFKV
jgi:hypothetical protein